MSKERTLIFEQKSRGISGFERLVIRLTDISIACVVVLLSVPVMIIIGIIIKFESPGPIIFKQVRMGKNRRNGQAMGLPSTNRERRRNNLCSRPFVFYKFRTMYSDAKERFPELYKYDYSQSEISKFKFKQENDPRLTKFGSYLRKTTLDELPNLFNVIKGDIALVGPRPDIPEMLKYYNNYQKNKFLIKPGVTGLAQVNGRGLLSFQETLEYDLQLVENYSFMFNLKILLKTVKVTFLRIGAF